jgi:hypothetical protein
MTTYTLPDQAAGIFGSTPRDIVSLALSLGNGPSMSNLPRQSEPVTLGRFESRAPTLYLHDHRPSFFGCARTCFRSSCAQANIVVTSSGIFTGFATLSAVDRYDMLESVLSDVHVTICAQS